MVWSWTYYIRWHCMLNKIQLKVLGGHGQLLFYSEYLKVKKKYIYIFQIVKSTGWSETYHTHIHTLGLLLSVSLTLYCLHTQYFFLQYFSLQLSLPWFFGFGWTNECNSTAIKECDEGRAALMQPLPGGQISFFYECKWNVNEFSITNKKKKTRCTSFIWNMTHITLVIKFTICKE